MGHCKPQPGVMLPGVLEQVDDQLVGVAVHLEDGVRLGEGIEEGRYLERGADGLTRVRMVRRGNQGCTEAAEVAGVEGMGGGGSTSLSP